ncbi:otoferlin-like isoform X3 [Anneissia japonica]|uniref:otoferlin-like isoform X3 n=1 Tax=Anneissia japonica TaxID=1529436 RepID=UPI001425585C|nr:otoferlin-like isoform X3 [Anneissia japonica]
MSLKIKLKSLVGFGKISRDRQVIFSFRGNIQKSCVQINTSAELIWNETLTWEIGTAITEREFVNITLIDYSRLFSNKPVGSFQLYLQELIVTGKLEINEPLLDNNNRQLKISVLLDLNYVHPEGLVGDWSDLRSSYYHAHSMDEVLLEKEFFESSTPSTPTEKRKKRRRKKKGNDATEEDDQSFVDDDSKAIEEESTLTDDYTFESMQDLTRQGDAGMELNTLPTQKKDYQISVHIIEARQIAGSEVFPIVSVQVGNITKFTQMKESTNTPFYDELFVYDFHDYESAIFDKVITFKVLNCSNKYLKTGKTIGFYKLDAGTVYDEPDHGFYNKWIILLDSKDINGTEKGYLKVNLSILGPGDPVKLQSHDVGEHEEEDIEANLLVPMNTPATRQVALYTVKIYRAEGLPVMASDILANVKKVFTGQFSDLVDSFVEVTFAGQMKRTSVKKHSYEPDWNQEIVFVDLFPPLCKRIKVQVRDKYSIVDDVIGTHYIDLTKVSWSDGFLPMFGPSWINMYGSTRGFNMFDTNFQLNDSEMEGCMYRGRLLLAMKCEMGNPNTASAVRVDVSPTLQISENAAGRNEDFCFFGCVFDASMIDMGVFGNYFERRQNDGNISFEFTIGNYGNTIDGKNIHVLPSMEPDEETGLLQRIQIDENCNSMTQPMAPIRISQGYCYMPYGEFKQCVSLRFSTEDHRRRFLDENILQGIADELEKDLSNCMFLQSAEHEDALKCFKKMVIDIYKKLHEYEGHMKSTDSAKLPNKNKLDKSIYKMTIEKVKRLAKEVKEMRGRNADSKQDTLSTGKLKWAKGLLQRLRTIAVNPQHCIPDLFIWLTCDDRRVAYTRIPSRKLLFSKDEKAIGELCGKMQTIFLKLPGKYAGGMSGWKVQTKLEVYLWLGLNKERKHILPGLPTGFDPRYGIARIAASRKTPPSVIKYTDHYDFQVRCHLYQARSLIGSDDSGLSDPFVRFFIGGQSQDSKIIFETLNPAWNEVLLFDKITVWGTKKNLNEEPPLGVAEVYDFDIGGGEEFIGRCLIKPIVKFTSNAYEWPELSWWKITRGPVTAGEVLVAVELIELTSTGKTPNGVPPITRLEPEKPEEKPPPIPMPMEIRPVLINYRIEILFWGVRELKRVLLLSVDRPRVEIECGGHVLHSSTIANAKRNLNFDDNIRYFDVELPENEVFCPPLNIRIVDVRNFGRIALVGTHVVHSISQYKVEFEDKPVFSIPATQAAITELPDEDKDKTQGNGILKSTSSVQNGHINEGNLHTGSENGALVNGDKPPTDMTSIRRNFSTVSFSPNGIVNEAYQDAVSIQIENDAAPTKAPSEVGSIRSQRSVGSQSKVVIASRRSSVTFAKATEFMTTSATDLLPMEGLSLFGMGKDKVEGQVEAKEEDGQNKDEQKDGGDKQPVEGQAAAPTAVPTVMGGDDANNDDPLPMDWWTKYYVSMYKQDKEEPDDGGSGEDEEESFITEAPSTTSKRRRRKTGNAFNRFRKSIKEKTARPEAVDEEVLEAMKPAPSDIECIECNHIKIYKSELELVPQFGGFKEWLRSFELYRGKNDNDEVDDSDRISGEFKGCFCLYRLPRPEGKILRNVLGFEADHFYFEGLPPPDPIIVLVRVYIIRALDLHPADINGKADPYLSLELGNFSTNTKEEYQSKQLNPYFGKCFEFEATFPMESKLRIKVYDWDLVGLDTLIGGTEIDLENRLYSKHRAVCGLAEEYALYGYNKWRDPEKPTDILRRLCRECHFDPPVYSGGGVVVVNGITIIGEANLVDDTGLSTPTDEHVALEALLNWEEIAGYSLVEEHVETRTLYTPERPGVDQGKIEMWVDMFPLSGPQPGPQTDISLRKAKTYELRVIIWNTEDVILVDDSLVSGDKMTDIFVRGWLKGVDDDLQVTDVHYRSLTGEGNFNWRYIFPFEYLEAERKIVVKKKEKKWSIDESEFKIPPKLNVQVWDADLVLSNDFLGSFQLDLTNFPLGAKSSKNCKPKRLTDPTVPHVSLFRLKRTRGWWPFVVKNDEKQKYELTGKVDMEMILMTEDEAQKSPAGLGRKEPDPMDPPNRPDTSFLSLMNPLNALKYLICVRLKILMIKLTIFLIIIAFIALFIYSSPGYVVKKIIGA